MRANLRLTLLGFVSILTPIKALSQTASAEKPDPRVVVTLTEDGAPTVRPWEKAAIISGTIDRDGKDYFEIHANADVQLDLSGDKNLMGSTRTLKIGPSVSWDRSTREGKEQDELKAGAVIYYYQDVNLGVVDPNSNPLSWAVQANFDLARTAVYADKKKAPCDTVVSSPLCEVQHKSSLKGKLTAFPYLPVFEDLVETKKLAYSFRPQFQIAHDEIVDATLDPTTQAKVTGGYTSALIGAGLNLRPQFDLPKFEFNATVQLRQRLGGSSSRISEIEKSAERFEASATYFLMQDDADPATKNWRVGISITWTEGSDPFEDKPDASTIMFGLRIGRF